VAKRLDGSRYHLVRRQASAHATLLDGDPAPAPQEGGTVPQFSAHVLWQNGWMDQDATWYGGRPRPRRHCVRWGPSPHGKGHSSPPLFGPCLLWPNGRPSQQLLSSCLYNYTVCIAKSHCHLRRHYGVYYQQLIKHSVLQD